METLYAGDSKVKKAKLQSFKVQYESLKMRDEETISKNFERIESIVNIAKGLGAEIPDSELVEKVLITLPIAYNPKVSTLEDREKLEEITMEELYGILTAYELRLGIDKYSKEEAQSDQENKKLEENILGQPSGRI